MRLGKEIAYGSLQGGSLGLTKELGRQTYRLIRGKQTFKGKTTKGQKVAVVLDAAGEGALVGAVAYVLKEEDVLPAVGRYLHLIV